MSKGFLKMLDETKLEIFGTEELAALFDEMSTEVQKNVVNIGFRKAGKILLDQIKNNLEGATKNSSKFTKKLGMKPVKEEFSMYVGFKRGGAANFANMLDQGTKERFYKTKTKAGFYRYKKNSTGMHKTGKINATNFFTNAIESTQEQVNTSVYQYISDAFTKLINKYNKRDTK